MTRNLDAHENTLIIASCLAYIKTQVCLAEVNRRPFSLDLVVQMHIIGGKVG